MIKCFPMRHSEKLGNSHYQLLEVFTRCSILHTIPSSHPTTVLNPSEMMFSISIFIKVDFIGETIPNRLGSISGEKQFPKLERSQNTRFPFALFFDLVFTQLSKTEKKYWTILEGKKFHWLLSEPFGNKSVCCRISCFYWFQKSPRKPLCKMFNL